MISYTTFYTLCRKHSKRRRFVSEIVKETIMESSSEIRKMQIPRVEVVGETAKSV